MVTKKIIKIVSFVTFLSKLAMKNKYINILCKFNYTRWVYNTWNNKLFVLWKNVSYKNYLQERYSINFLVNEF